MLQEKMKSRLRGLREGLLRRNATLTVRMVAIAERSPFTAEADKPLDLARKAKKLAN